MEGRLCECGKIAGKRSEIFFNYKGLSVREDKPGSQCSDCTQKDWIKRFEKYAEKLIIGISVDGAEVDWEKYISNGKERFEINRIFASLGIFSSDIMGNWIILANGQLGLNPEGHPLFNIYFTRRRDVEKFARLKYDGSLYPWEICHINKAIKKSDIYGDSDKK